MCDLCGHFPCISRCPNYEPEAVYTCDRCGVGIYDGETFYQINDISDVKTLIICEDCISDTKQYAEHEEYEPDGCDLYKEKVERMMIDG